MKSIHLFVVVVVVICVCVSKLKFLFFFNSVSLKQTIANILVSSSSVNNTFSITFFYLHLNRIQVMDNKWKRKSTFPIYSKDISFFSVGEENKIFSNIFAYFLFKKYYFVRLISDAIQSNNKKIQIFKRLSCLQAFSILRVSIFCF